MRLGAPGDVECAGVGEPVQLIETDPELLVVVSEVKVAAGREVGVREEDCVEVPPVTVEEVEGGREASRVGVSEPASVDVVEGEGVSESAAWEGGGEAVREREVVGLTVEEVDWDRGWDWESRGVMLGKTEGDTRKGEGVVPEVVLGEREGLSGFFVRLGVGVGTGMHERRTTEPGAPAVVEVPAPV